MIDSPRVKKAMEYRNSAAAPNCAQTVLVAFADKTGLTEEQAHAISANFGGGMRTGSVCGAVTGAIMALGAMGITSPSATAEIQKKMKENHDGTLECATLLKNSTAKGIHRREHCDGLIKEAIALVEEYL